MMTHKEGKIGVFYGAPIDNAAEAACLRKLKRDLSAQGTDAVLLANLTLGPKRRQVDLVVATDGTAVAVEIKGYLHPAKGGVNGSWNLDLGGGKKKKLGSRSPYEQALANRYAVTDQLSALCEISSDTAKDAVAGMLCLYPEPIVGSQVPEPDFKLTIGGYEKLLRMLKTTRRKVVPLEEWRRFALMLGLNESGVALPTAAEAKVAEYLAAYHDLASISAGPYIEPQFDEADTTRELAERIMAGAQAQIVGNSGSGKTELIKVVARLTAQAGAMPIFLCAREFETRLAPLLQTSIARSTALSPNQLFKAAAKIGAEIILFVDGMNECPPNRRSELVEALQAARLKFGVRLVLTAQEPISLPTILRGEIIRLLQPDSIQSQRLVATHLGRELTDNERRSVEVVATAHGAAVLAAVFETPSKIDGRFALYHSFVRKLLHNASAEEVEHSLAALATSMRTNFVSSLPVPAAERMLEGNKQVTKEAACSAGLIRTHDNQLAFRHELIADFFAAAEILHRAKSVEELSEIARQPINAELREFLLGGCGTTSEIEAMIGKEPDPRLLRVAFLGHAGQKARNYVIGRLRDLISELGRNYSKVTLALPEGLSSARDLSSLVPSFPDELENGEIDKTYLGLIPYALRDSLLPDLLDLFASVDRRLSSEAQRLQGVHPDLRISWHAAAYGSVYGMHYHHAGGRDLQQLLHDIQNRGFYGSDSVPVHHLECYLDSFETLSPGQIFLLVGALRAASNASLPSRFVELIQHTWDLRIYHLRLLICDVIRFRGSELPRDQRQAISGALHGWMSNQNIFINSIIIDALEGVDGIEIEITVEDAVEEYESVLALPDTPEACAFALGAITRTYDHPFRDIYWEAFYKALPVEKRQRLLLRGLRDERRDPWFIDDVLRALLREPTAAAAPELQKLAQIPIVESHSPQLALNVYANSIALLAKLAVPLALPDPPPRNPASQAWYRAAPLIYALNIDPTLSSGKMAEEVDNFRVCGAAEAFDVVQRLTRERRNMLRPANVEFESSWPDLILELCRAVLSPDYAPASIFERVFTDRALADDHLELALSLLAKVGRTTDIALVSRWLNHPKHGERALQAARSLEQRSH
ncbi:NERD domain-containing protein [Phaeobacter inhibens]|uniref:NERD domain-containing protein n=1 Tax=Phaeobacter inhibens TaxID=221822 RepID=UPI0021A50A4C|nr:NERD domain-containing protein [Phaeobacter inhibens]UWR64838.1 NERD domain-containing protein [Phaeobacter inhibens]